MSGPDEEPPLTDIWGEVYEAPSVERRDVMIDGVRYHVERAGQGPSLVLLHGFTGSVGTWARLRPAFASRYTTITVDLPGHGRTNSPDDRDRYTLDRFADDLGAILDALDVQRTALVGYSLGGRAAMRFAVRHPSRVAALILESASGGIVDESERAARVAADEALADSIERDGIAAFVDRWEQLPLWASQVSVPPSSRARLRAQRLANDPKGLANSLRAAGAGADPSVFDRLASITAPTLVVVGKLDEKYLDQGARLVESFPFGQIRVVEYAGHAIHFEKPDSFVRGVMGFLDSVAREAEWS